jgi:hypothetical protein
MCAGQSLYQEQQPTQTRKQHQQVPSTVVLGLVLTKHRSEKHNNGRLKEVEMKNEVCRDSVQYIPFCLGVRK